MSDLQLLVAVRRHLLARQVTPRIHLAVPPKATYPLILIDLEEAWSSYSSGGNPKGTDIQARVKFKASVYSQDPGMEEATSLSHRVRNALEGATLCFAEKSSTIRFLACVAETLGKMSRNPELRVIHHFYDGIVRGGANE